MADLPSAYAGATRPVSPNVDKWLRTVAKQLHPSMSILDDDAFALLIRMIRLLLQPLSSLVAEEVVKAGPGDVSVLFEKANVVLGDEMFRWAKKHYDSVVEGQERVVAEGKNGVSPVKELGFDVDSIFRSLVSKEVAEVAGADQNPKVFVLCAIADFLAFEILELSGNVRRDRCELVHKWAQKGGANAQVLASWESLRPLDIVQVCLTDQELANLLFPSFDLDKDVLVACMAGQDETQRALARLLFIEQPCNGLFDFDFCDEDTFREMWDALVYKGKVFSCEDQRVVAKKLLPIAESTTFDVNWLWFALNASGLLVDDLREEYFQEILGFDAVVFADACLRLGHLKEALQLYKIAKRLGPAQLLKSMKKKKEQKEQKEREKRERSLRRLGLNSPMYRKLAPRKQLSSTCRGLMSQKEQQNLERFLSLAIAEIHSLMADETSAIVAFKEAFF
eukprot:CAMPEP_0175154596 /NCGR_PEP_ID=MMETSP0087-20121206/20447_1 /TAXON_ID=136419 /ORGANISM="Unknown Unknown, Strain D1" /LENGTH=450 /DNA_ID=CAMNT_0016441537 /DNA_START=104 /DNA_END=1456 /DNA_ORIENTATION=+